MEKIIFKRVLFIVLVVFFMSCENNDLSDETYESTNIYATGQGEVGDPVEEDDEEGFSN